MTQRERRYLERSDDSRQNFKAATSQLIVRYATIYYKIPLYPFLGRKSLKCLTG